MIRGVNRKEPLWWGRGAQNCLAIWPNKNGPYHQIFIGNGKVGTEGEKMEVATDELIEMAIFLLQVANGSAPEPASRGPVR